MAITTLISPRPVPAGTFQSPSTDIASDPSDRTLVLHILSNDWTTGESGLIVDFEIDLSFDGGQTFQPQVIGETHGGAVNSRNGQLPTISVGLPANTAMKLRASATLNQAANSIGLGYEIL